MCVSCGQAVASSRKRALLLKHVHPTAQLQVGDQDAVRCKMSHMQQLLRSRKLVLVLDLDHTMLHSDVREGMSDTDVWRASAASDVHSLLGGSLVTKLRPHARPFLARAREMFDLCIYTMGTRAYAAEVRAVLDPEGRLFSSVISRDDSTAGSAAKDLDVLMADPQVTLIVDDCPCMWPNHGDNVFGIAPYRFFRRAGGEEADEQLLVCMEVLESVHESYFECNGPSSPTVGHVSRHLRSRRRSILKDCVLLFASGWASGLSVAEASSIWTAAVDMGADCVLSPSPPRQAGDAQGHGEEGEEGAEGEEGEAPTHVVVSLDSAHHLPDGAATYSPACRLVLPGWIIACAVGWCHVSEGAYTVTR